MIKFFRKIRQNLLSEGNTGKYLKYAIGEIVLVVFGILIALQLNNWNQYLKDRENEKQILIQLKSEFEENLIELNKKVAMRRKMISSVEHLFEIKKENNNIKIPLDTLRLYIAWTNNTPTFDPVMGATNELLSSGKLYLIGNDSLKVRLTNLAGQIERLIEYEQDLRTYQLHNYDPFLTQNFSVKDLFDGIYQEKEYYINKSNRENAVDEFINNKAVDNYIFTIASYCDVTNQESVSLRKYLNQILRLINLELKK